MEVAQENEQGRQKRKKDQPADTDQQLGFDDENKNQEAMLQDGSQEELQHFQPIDSQFLIEHDRLELLEHSHRVSCDYSQEYGSKDRQLLDPNAQRIQASQSVCVPGPRAAGQQMMNGEQKKKADKKSGPLQSLKTLFRKDNKKKQMRTEDSYPAVRSEEYGQNEDEGDLAEKDADKTVNKDANRLMEKSRQPAAAPSIEAVSAIQLAAPAMSGADGRERFVSDNLAEFLSEDYLEVDMGQLKDEERQFMVVDKDTGRVYDLRNERHVERLTESEIVKATSSMPTNESSQTTESKSMHKSQNVKKQNTKPNVKKSMGSGWSDWWQQKKANNEEFLLAAEFGDLPKLKKYLSTEEMQGLQADVNAKALDSWTALHLAAKSGHVEVVKVLLAQTGVEVEARSAAMKRTPLHVAAEFDQVEIVKLVVAQGADVNCRDFDESSPLHFASEHGSLKTLDYLLTETKADIGAKNKFGYAASDIAQNLDVRQRFQKLDDQGQQEGSSDLAASKQAQNAQYARTAFNGVLMHNDRINSVQRLMNKYQHVNKYLGQIDNGKQKHNEQQIIKNIESQEEKQKNNKIDGAQNQQQKNDQDNNGKEQTDRSSNMRWKQKFLKLRVAGDKFDKQKEEEEKKAFEGWEEDSVGPDNFRVLSKLGQGSFGVVYLVEKLNIMEDGTRVETNELYAMKILNKKQIMGQNLVKYAKTERDVLTYATHPFVVGMRYAFQTPEKLFMILDYAAGGNMSRALHKEKKFSEEKAVMFMAEILLALEDLHKRDVIYRDLKPDNIVFDSQGHALLTDFGLSKEDVYDDAMAKSFCGSPAYLAPEMLKRTGHGKSIDWYLLGVLLYEMLVGIPPYYSNNKEQLYENIQRGPLKLPNFLSEDARSLLISLLNRNPHKRLGAGPNGAEDIKKHIFFKQIDWRKAELRQLPVPPPYMKKLATLDVPIEKVYGKGAFDDGLKDYNRLRQWSFVQKKGGPPQPQDSQIS